jgi:hypothetical protein
MAILPSSPPVTVRPSGSQRDRIHRALVKAQHLIGCVA